MNKYLFFTLLLLAGLLIGYNITMVDMEDPLSGDSLVAVICALAAVCAVVVLLIYRTSKKIADKVDAD